LPDFFHRWSFRATPFGIDFRNNVTEPELQMLSVEPGWYRSGSARVCYHDNMRNVSGLMLAPLVRGAYEKPLRKWVHVEWEVMLQENHRFRFSLRVGYLQVDK